ncbi:glutamine-hydrolyzing GMP synthase [Candidatus Gottesmanbacteria bacterium]|nr:glutamine-hydrolyzing GMP synthase [Candidatus Gottesmanbacteria bacterium]
MILIVDFGSQTAHLIGRRLRDLGVVSEYCHPEDVIQKIQELRPKGIILSGGPSSVYDVGAPTVDPTLFSLTTPILGICYGWQLMAQLLGGKVENTTKEYGPELLRISKFSSIFCLPQHQFPVVMSHGDSVTKLPPGFTAIAHTAQVRFAGVENANKKFYGVHFHPEADHTTHGSKLLENFVVDVCGETLAPLLIDPNALIQTIKKTVGNSKVICAVSGGVDSTVAAFLIGKAIGKNLIPVYVDSGLMRPGTEQRVRHIFTKLIKADLVIVNAKKQFMKALKGMTDPEEKRKTVGKLYIDIFQKQANKHKDATFLAQGTIYSDVIESKGSKHASHIKSHHNVGGLPKDLKFQLIEPLRTFYKDEVRKIGTLVGLPDMIVSEQVFPGPGYAVRIRGEVTEERLDKIKQADSIVVEEMKKANLYDKIFMCFAIMTDAYSTAVKGDGRVFAEVVAIRSVDSKDVMTSEWTRIPHEVLHAMSSRIVNEVPHVSRVVYDITTKPPATMEWE